MRDIERKRQADIGKRIEIKAAKVKKKKMRLLD